MFLYAILFLVLSEPLGSSVVSSRLSEKDQHKQTRIVEGLSSLNMTVVEGETVMLVCTVLNLNDKSVSWVRLNDPIPQLMSLNNVTNSLNPRVRALVTDWKEFVLMVKDVKTRDAGAYQCQVSGPNHTSLTRTVVLNVIEGETEILDGPVIYVDPRSTLVLTCRVDFGPKTPEFIIWRKQDKILKFEGGEAEKEPFLEVDSEGRHLSHLTVKEVGSQDSGQYFCQPAIGPQHSVTVHVLDRFSDVLPVLGEDPGEENIVVDLASSALINISNIIVFCFSISSLLVC